MSGRVARLCWALWHALLLFATVGLLATIVYIAAGAPPREPSAWPILFTGLLIWCLLVLIVISAVDAVLWATAQRWTWGRRLALVPAVLLGGTLLFALALWTTDSSNEAVAWIGLSLFTSCVLGAHLLNRYAVRRFRTAR
jgi:hypothetical protein